MQASETIAISHPPEALGRGATLEQRVAHHRKCRDWWNGINLTEAKRYDRLYHKALHELTRCKRRSKRG